MPEIEQLMLTIRWQLKKQGKTYRDVADALKLSEPSIKRIFSPATTAQIGIERIVEISHFLGFTLLELVQEADLAQSKLRTLNANQEKELVSDPELMLVAVCAINQWTMEDILESYTISETVCLQKLLKLDHLGVIVLLPGNRIRLNISRDFDWLLDGPIRAYFKEEGMVEFLDSHFRHEGENLVFSHGMLTDTAAIKFQNELRQLKRRFAELHAESLSAPLKKRTGTALLMACRPWEPSGFAKLRKAHS